MFGFIAKTQSKNIAIKKIIKFMDFTGGAAYNFVVWRNNKAILFYEWQVSIAKGGDFYFLSDIMQIQFQYASFGLQQIEIN